MSAKNKKGSGRAGGRVGGGTGSRGGSQSGNPGPKRPYSTIDLKATEISPKDENTAPEFGSAASTQPQKDKTTDGKSTTGSGVPNTGKSSDSASASSAAAKPADAKSSPTSSGRAADKSSAGKSAAGTAAASTSSKSPSAGSQSMPPPKTAKATKQKSGGGGFFSHLAAAIFASVLTLFGAKYAGQYLDIPGLSLADNSARFDSTEITTRLDSLEKTLTAQAGKPAGSADTAALNKDLAALQTRLGKLEAIGSSVAALQAAQTKLQTQTTALRETAGKGAGANPELTGRLAQLEQTLAALGAAANKDPDNAGRIPQLAAISGRLNDLETALKTRMTALRTDLVQEIDNRASTMSEASESAKSGTQRLDRDVAGLRASTAKLDQRLIELGSGSKQMRESLRVVQEETGNLKVALDTLSGDVTARLKQTAKPADVSAAIAPIAKKIGALEQNLQSVVQSESTRKSNAQRIILALELGNLKRALDRGQDFTPELKQVKRVSAGKLDLSVLEAHSGNGVPTLGELQKEFGTLAFKMIDAATVRENATVMDRLLNGAKSMVRVRRVNHSRDDNSAEAIVGRMDGALKDGRLGDVLTEAAKLPKKSRAPAADWLAKVKARQSVDQALGQLESKLKSSLGGTATDERG